MILKKINKKISRSESIGRVSPTRAYKVSTVCSVCIHVYDNIVRMLREKVAMHPVFTPTREETLVDNLKKDNGISSFFFVLPLHSPRQS